MSNVKDGLKGYVAVAFNYRLGWNASSSVQEVRTATVIQAVYRGMQDARTVTRFMRSTHDNGNTYGINPSKIVLGGHGSGGYVSLAVATLDTAMEMYLPKFIFQQTVNHLLFLNFTEIFLVRIVHFIQTVRHPSTAQYHY